MSDENETLYCAICGLPIRGAFVTLDSGKVAHIACADRQAATTHTGRRYQHLLTAFLGGIATAIAWEFGDPIITAIVALIAAITHIIVNRQWWRLWYGRISRYWRSRT